MTISSILETYKKLVEENRPISPGTWLNAASQLNVLLMDHESALIEAKMKVNTRLSEILADPEVAVARARAIVKGTPEFKEQLVLEALKERAQEFIRLAKKSTDLQAWDV